MPQMSGRELAERLMPHQPDLKVLYMSGYAERAIVHRGRLDEETAFLQKPFALGASIAKVRTVLSPSRTPRSASRCLPSRLNGGAAAGQLAIRHYSPSCFIAAAASRLRIRYVPSIGFDR
jgi:DNA-binding NtrC family response regulator